MEKQQLSQIAIIEDALKGPLDEEAYIKVLSCAFFIQIGAVLSEDDTSSMPFTPTQREIAIKDFIYKWNILGSLGIPFEEWKDVAEEGLMLVRRFIENPEQITFDQLEGVDTFLKHFVEKYQSILGGKYGEMFLNAMGR